MAKIAQPAPRPRSDDPNLLLGVAASPGLAVGTTYQVRRAEIMVEEEGRGVQYEQERLAHAIGRARGELEGLRASLHAKADPAKAAIFAAHAELLDDPDFLEIANSAIAKGKSAAFAWKKATELHAERLAALRNELLAQRANDVRDVGQRVLLHLTGIKQMPPTYPERSVLIAEDLAASDAAAMEARNGRRFRYRTRRRDFARRDSRPFVRHSRGCRHRASRSRSSKRHASHTRWRERFASALAPSRGSRDDS